MNKYNEYKSLNLVEINNSVLEAWKKNKTFQQSLSSKEKEEHVFTFYEGPPSANGLPGIHHVIARTIKDLFCRYKTLQGFTVDRKAGWDTHGLPVELGVEKKLGLTKEDIGNKISIEDYNLECKKDVLKYQKEWEKLTEKMGYWVDMKNPYITYENKYIESVWWVISELHKKNLLYKGFTVQPYSPKAGTGLSTHELNQPGCYRNVKDTSAVVMFPVVKNKESLFLFNGEENIYFIAWTTTPWTLPSNTALAVGKKIDYVKVTTYNRYTANIITVIIAKNLLPKYFKNDISLSDYKEGDKDIPFKVNAEFKGNDLEGIKYEQLLKYKKPKIGDAFRVIIGDFVTTDDGTGIVHIAPSFGADDNLIAKKNGIGSLTLVDQQGRFTKDVSDFAGQYVKHEYYSKKEKKPKHSIDVQIVIKIKELNLLFKSEKYEHSYPHCWRTDKPILYYPMDSWFVKTTDYKKRMIELNNTINWKPKSTGEGRFGNWLENLVDWNLSRSRFWGIPIPIWRTEDAKEEICISSLEMLKDEIEKAVKANVMSCNPLKTFCPGDFSEKNYNIFDLHRPHVDDIILVSKSGKPMKRELDLIDVWFDSGSMPYAQLHYPFENKRDFEKMFPADFIAEGVDQTRGWFFTLHAISTMLFDKASYKTVISNGLVLDKNGNKMSKRLGNSVDPFEMLNKYGADATRWYMIASTQPWDNLRFDELGIQEIQRKYFGTLYNTYSFFALYANIDGFSFSEKILNEASLTELDNWILSELHSLIFQTKEFYDDYEPTKVARLIQDFVVNKLSNWYVRLSRRRFWKGDYKKDKIAAYQTLYSCLETIAIISSPISPFFSEKLFQDLNLVTNKNDAVSVHISSFPKYNKTLIKPELEEKMLLAQNLVSLVLSLRKKENIRVRKPLKKIIVPVLSQDVREKIEEMKELILSEINVKEIEFINEESDLFRKKIKPNFKILGPKYGSELQKIKSFVEKLDKEQIMLFENTGALKVTKNIVLSLDDVEFMSQDIPGWLVANNDFLTVALDINTNEDLENEWLSREFVNRIQNIRKDLGLEVIDNINISIEKSPHIESVIKNNLNYICNETLTKNITFVNDVKNTFKLIELTKGVSMNVLITKC
ncbi:MAG: isoleucine--tRNA ligase [Bacteroidota bacterium]|nr:isoleucine--tRNA ligase [Bacteroidota bacterium]